MCSVFIGRGTFPSIKQRLQIPCTPRAPPAGYNLRRTASAVPAHNPLQQSDNRTGAGYRNPAPHNQHHRSQRRLSWVRFVWYETSIRGRRGVWGQLVDSSGIGPPRPLSLCYLRMIR